MRAPGQAARAASSAGSVRHTSPMKRGRTSSMRRTAAGSGDRSKAMSVEYDGSMTDRRGDHAKGSRDGHAQEGGRRAKGPATRAVHGATDAPGGAMSTPI